MKQFLASHEVSVGDGKYYLKGLTKEQFDAALTAIIAVSAEPPRELVGGKINEIEAESSNTVLGDGK